MSAHLILGGARPVEATGNVLLDKMLGARIYFVNSDDWEKESRRIASDLEAKGGRFSESLSVVRSM